MSFNDFGKNSYVTVRDDGIVLFTPYHKQFVAEVKEIPGREWVPGDIPFNRFPKESATHVINLCERWRINITPTLADLPPSDNLDANPRTINRDGSNLAIKFLYDPIVLADLKKHLPQARWFPAAKTWRIADDFAEAVIDFAKRWDFSVQPGISEDIDALVAERNATFELSQAVHGEIELENVSEQLLPYQRVGVAYLLQARRAILGDQPGLGKSLQALSALASEGAFPAVVVAPNTLKLNWRNEIRKFYPNLTVNVVSGRKSEDLPAADITVINYDIVADRVDDLLALNPVALVADESHAIKNGKAIHKCPICESKVRVNARKCPSCNAMDFVPVKSWTVKRAGGVLRLAEAIPDGGFVLLLTGTPITNRPIELVPQLEAIGALDRFGGRWRFQERYCPNGKGAAFMDELNKKMRSTCYIRRKKQDVYGELPDVRNAVQILNIPDSAYKRYYEIEQDVVEFLANKAREVALEEGRDPDAAYLDKYNQLRFSEQLVKLTVLRDAVSQMKYDAITEWLDQFLADSDEKVVIFAEHIDFVEKLYERYSTISVKVRGGVSTDDRMAAVERFQNDPECRLFIGNMAAASEGLTLTAASDVVFCELGWTPAIHEQCVGRCYGRVNDLHGATAWYLLAEDTIDQDIFELLEKKKVIVDAVTDGENPVEGGNVMIDLLKKLTERGLNGDTR